MIKNLPSLKAKPQLIPPVLRCIRDNAWNYKKMESCVAALWQEKSQRTKVPTVRNSLRAVFGPSLRHLQLIRGERDSLIIMSMGKNLLDSYESEGDPGFKREFAKHFVRLDRDEGMCVLFELKRMGGSASIESLLNRLRAENPESSVTEDRLRKFLLYCNFLNLVKVEDGKVELRELQFKNSLHGIDISLSVKEFIEVLIKKYDELRTQLHGSPYVAIPDLRDSICEATGISLDYFNKKLQEVPKESSSYLIHLTEPMQRKSGGIRLAGRYLYYAAIYKK